MNIVIRLAILLLRPYEMWRERQYKKAYRAGKYRRPADIGSPAVTTRRKELV